MSQSTFAIPNQSGANYRVAVNNALQALASLYSGTTPSESYAYQLWFDTSTNILKQRNAANNAWVNLWGATLGSPVVIDFRNTQLEVHGAGNIASNTAVGRDALQANTSGTANTALGYVALQANTIGSGNTAVGAAALYLNNTGINNTAVGVQALENNTSGPRNTAVGQNALQANTIGASNTAVGAAALYLNTSGTANTALGYVALQANTIGSNNTAVGYLALSNSISGSNNTAIGFNAGTSITTQSNQFILGNSSVALLQCAVNLSLPSDGRDKKDIKELNFSGLEYINALIPRTYTWNMRPCVGDKKDVTEIGFVAQEVESVQSTVHKIPGIVTTFDIDYTDPETGEHTVTDRKMITPALLIPVLVKAIQEISQRLTDLEA
jgi:hypothetical protein